MTSNDSKCENQTQASGTEALRYEFVDHDAKPFWSELARFGAQEALITPDKRLTYAGLGVAMAVRLADLRARLPRSITRPLIAVEMSNDLSSVVTYLAALDADWPILLLEPGAASGKARDLVERYMPNLLCDARGQVHVNVTPCLMHANLRLLMSTSGSTGTAKLVRLSGRNIASNALAIAQYLGLTGSDRAITTLPLHYSYGLSVLHSYLAVGAPLILNARSVTEPEFWQFAQSEGATSLALVPAQIEGLNPETLAERLPDLRYVTQAGGRLSSQTAQRFAIQNWSFVMMYGQTEAAPRMAYLPPEMARDNPDAIGRAIPGGSLVLLAEDGSEIEAAGQVGELVYRGPNVMMGYAQTRADLILGADTTQLHTGDLAERNEAGLFRIKGRKSRFIKPYSKRICLDDVEAAIHSMVGNCFAVGTDDYLAVFVFKAGDGLARRLADQYGLPLSAVHVFEQPEMPYLASGKPDYKTLSKIAAKNIESSAAVDLHDILCRALGRSAVDMSCSFKELGGDSLAYLQVQLCLAERGTVPDLWEDQPLRDLDATLTKTNGDAWVDLPAELGLRVLAICSVLALHATDLPLSGGTYVLLILAGVSLARFQSTRLGQGRILAVLRTMLLPLLAGYFVILGGIHLMRAPVPGEWFMLLANLSPSAMIPRLQPYWFVNAYAQAMLLACLPFAIKPLRKKITDQPFVAGLVALALLSAMSLFLSLDDMPSGLRQRHPIAALELCAIGWSIFFAKRFGEKLVIGVVCAAIYLTQWADAPTLGAGFFLAGATLLILSAKLPVPQNIFRAVAGLGALTMIIYLLHPVFVSIALGLELPQALRFLIVATGSILSAIAVRFVTSRVIRIARRGFGGT